MFCADKFKVGSYLVPSRVTFPDAHLDTHLAVPCKRKTVTDLMRVLVRVPVAVMKHHDQKQTGEARVYLAYTSTSQSITERNQERNSSRAGTRS